MTEELFRDDATLTQCEARVIALSEGGLVLDRTVFYPLGGGQAGDTGVLRLADGRELIVTDTRKSREHPGGVLHVLAPDALVAVGDAVTAQIDVDRRSAHRRFHTTTHLLCALVPHPVDGCSITAAYARLDFHMNEPLDKQLLSEGIARLVPQARLVKLPACGHSPHRDQPAALTRAVVSFLRRHGGAPAAKEVPT